MLTAILGCILFVARKAGYFDFVEDYADEVKYWARVELRHVLRSVKQVYL
jgi:hypothetical protein